MKKNISSRFGANVSRLGKNNRKIRRHGKQRVSDLSKINREEKVTYRGLYTSFSNECENLDGRIALCGLSRRGTRTELRD